MSIDFTDHRLAGQTFINDRDAWFAWGIFLAETALTTLLTPAPLKPYIENKSALESGKQVLTDDGTLPLTDERDLQLEIYLRARDFDDFITKYNAFTEELKKGRVDIRTRYQPDVIYHCIYISCAQFSLFNGRLAKFALKLNEPDPENRIA